MGITVGDILETYLKEHGYDGLFNTNRECQLLNAGVREELLQALFGHKDRQSTKRYAKLVSDSLKWWEE